jgi:hypothetical protein
MLKNISTKVNQIAIQTHYVTFAAYTPSLGYIGKKFKINKIPPGVNRYVVRSSECYV